MQETWQAERGTKPVYDSKSLLDPPGGDPAPGAQLLFRPIVRLRGVARDARVRNLVQLCRRGRDEFETVAPHVHVGDGLLDLWHVTLHALAAAAARGVMCVCL